MSKWIKDNIESLWKILIGLFLIVSFALTMEFKVQEVESRQKNHIRDYEQFRYQTVPKTYMRKDVMEQVLLRLKRIEHKIDEQNDR